VSVNVLCRRTSPYNDIATSSLVDPFITRRLRIPVHTSLPIEITLATNIIMSNQAAWILEPKGQLQVKEAPMPKADKGEVVIKNHAVAVNPVDCGFMHNCWLFDCAD
jgi:hypothetical protein